MSVLMTMRVKGDPTKLEAAERDVVRGVVEKAKQHGLIAHHFFGTDDEVLVVDEWPDEASFRTFFDSAPEIQEIFGRAGVTTEPQITFWRHLDVGDDYGWKVG